jgi:hypothetical protein
MPTASASRCWPTLAQSAYLTWNLIDDVVSDLAQTKAIEFRKGEGEGEGEGLTGPR